MLFCGIHVLRCSRKLPICQINPPSRIPEGQGPGLAQICGGLGYDAAADDYKVVRITQWYHPNDQPSLISEVMVYNLKLDVWKKVQDCLYWLVREGNGTFAGGALNCMATKEPLMRESSLILVDLNLGSERVEEMPFAQNLGKPFRLNLAVSGECLCLILGYVTDVKNHVLNHVDIWVMKDYGVKESWVKFSIEQLRGSSTFQLSKANIIVTGRGAICFVVILDASFTAGNVKVTFEMYYMFGSYKTLPVIAHKYVS